MWELDYKESWVLKNWCFWTVVLEKTPESPLDCKEIQPVHPKGDQSWVYIGRTDVEVETPILWPPDAKSWLIWKDPDAGKDWGQEEKGTTEDEMVGWHHRLNGHGFGCTPGVGAGQGGLACCGSLGRKESDTTERLNWTFNGHEFEKIWGDSEGQGSLVCAVHGIAKSWTGVSDWTAPTKTTSSFKYRIWAFVREHHSVTGYGPQWGAGDITPRHLWLWDRTPCPPSQASVPQAILWKRSKKWAVSNKAHWWKGSPRIWG